MATRLINLRGLQFGRWTVHDRVGDGSPPRWLCVCSRGRSKSVRGQDLRAGISRSCGCIGAERFRAMNLRGENNASTQKARMRHGADYVATKDWWYRRAAGIRQRCRITGLEFGFSSIAECAAYLKSITPTRCPVFGVAFQEGGKGFSPLAPSADRIDSTQGYTRGNLQVISFRANSMKADATRSELEKFARWVLAEGPWPQ